MLCEERTLATSCNMLRGSKSSSIVLVFLQAVVVIDNNDNVSSDGIDCKRLIKRSKYGWEVLKIIVKEHNEQADLLTKDVMISIDESKYVGSLNSSYSS